MKNSQNNHRLLSLVAVLAFAAVVRIGFLTIEVMRIVGEAHSEGVLKIDIFDLLF
ncbi:MAG: hypothetical protein J6C45_06450 [Alistipes sp.]|nr:hypothetical protein [Alistipes sp.]